MSIIIQPEESDFLVGRKLDERWYLLEIAQVESKPAKKDAKKSVIHISFVVVGPNDSQGNPAGVQVKKYYGETGIKFLVADVKAMGFEIEKGERFDVERLKGKRCDGYIKLKEYEDNLQNDVVKFAPAGKFSELVAQ